MFLTQETGDVAMTSRQKVMLGTSALALALFVLPLTAVANTVLQERDVVRVLGAITSWYHKKTFRELKHVEAACYFDPQVESSMVCPYRFETGAADSFRMRQRVRRDGTKWCKQRGGEDCTLFWRNGKLEFDSLSPDDAARLESVVRNMHEWDLEAKPLPDGVEVSDNFLERFEEVREYWEDYSKKQRRRNPNYAICAGNSWASTYEESGNLGRRDGLSAVREMCILKCNAISEWYSREGRCYLIYENGEFASGAARQAITQ